MVPGPLGTLMISKETISSLMVTANLVLNQMSFKNKTLKKVKRVEATFRMMTTINQAVRIKS